MKLRQFACPICSSTPSTSDKAPAVVSPWIRELGIRAIKSTFLVCKKCEFGYFSRRYSPEEMALIYSEYRGVRYTEIRGKWEPWYSLAYNSNHDESTYILKRRKVLREFIDKNVDGRIRKVVDVGGDRGQYIPDFDGASKFVLEMSDKVVLENVQRIEDFQNISDIDLIIFSHVLEHVIDPMAELSKLANLANYVYVEVPFGIPAINSERRSYLKFLRHLHSSLFRASWGKRTSPSTSRDVFPVRILTQSEHLNFFSEKSLSLLARELNLDVVTAIASVYTPDFTQGTVIQCLFKARF